ncbi:hypothetical protein LA66_15080 [Aureimonas altamirensis]|uniref:Uncharacterized protein n=1 Tax=Aureimonas altamirensis TaxID=370622 RepID=A0A0B1Q4Z5_9HYPH|nr:hypothetical protein LA66_15080 [Aureimonas altamirensis]
MGKEGIRLSLAGAQHKLAVRVKGESIGLAEGGRPTTHILKRFILALDGTIENDLFCLRLAGDRSPSRYGRNRGSRWFRARAASSVL